MAPATSRRNRSGCEETGHGECDGSPCNQLEGIAPVGETGAAFALAGHLAGERGSVFRANRYGDGCGGLLAHGAPQTGDAIRTTTPAKARPASAR